MLFLLVAGVFSAVAPTWMICACGLGRFEDEAWLQWSVRMIGLTIAGLVLCFGYARH